MKIFGLLLTAILCAQVHGQPISLSNLPPLPKVQPKKKVDPNGLIHAAANTDWRGWMANNFPDQSKSWSDEAAKSFKALVNEGKWDYVGKGDIDRDGKPTGLFIRFLPSKKPDAGAIANLTIAKWLDAKWVKMIDLGSDKGARMNGSPVPDLTCPDGYLIDLVLGNPRNAERPGMFFFLELANRMGEGMSDPAQIYFVPKDKKYAMSDE